MTDRQDTAASVEAPETQEWRIEGGGTADDGGGLGDTVVRIPRITDDGPVLPAPPKPRSGRIHGGRPLGRKRGGLKPRLPGAVPVAEQSNDAAAEAAGEEVTEPVVEATETAEVTEAIQAPGAEGAGEAEQPEAENQEAKSGEESEELPESDPAADEADAMDLDEALGSDSEPESSTDQDSSDSESESTEAVVTGLAEEEVPSVATEIAANGPGSAPFAPTPAPFPGAAPATAIAPAAPVFTSAPPTAAMPAAPYVDSAFPVSAPVMQPKVTPPAPPVAAAAPKPKSASLRRTRKARLRLARVDPWSVMKTSFLFSIAFGIMFWVMVSVTWSVITTSGLFEVLNTQVGQILSSPQAESTFRVEDYINTNRVLGITALLAVVNVVIGTALGTLSAFLYNLSAGILGGLELTLAED